MQPLATGRGSARPLMLTYDGQKAACEGEVVEGAVEAAGACCRRVETYVVLAHCSCRKVVLDPGAGHGVCS